MGCFVFANKLLLGTTWVSGPTLGSLHSISLLSSNNPNEVDTIIAPFYDERSEAQRELLRYSLVSRITHLLSANTVIFKGRSFVGKP